MVKLYKIIKFSEQDSYFGLEEYVKDILFEIVDVNHRSSLKEFRGLLKCATSFKLPYRTFPSRSNILIYSCHLEEVKLNPEDWV